MVLNELAGDAWKAAQMSVIGALLLWPDDLSGKIFRAAKPTYFSDSTLRHLFEAAQGLWFDRKPIDPVTVLHAAGMDGHQETVSACMQAVPTRANIDEHLHILHDEARLYQIRMAASELAWCKSEGEALEAYERMGQLLRETDTMFKMPKGFDIDSVFYDSYGIFFPKEGEKPQTIRFKASPEEAKYLRDLPLHRSQKEEGDGVFRIRVIPNEDLMMEFCKHAGKLEVIEPESLRSALKERLDKASKQYS